MVGLGPVVRGLREPVDEGGLRIGALESLLHEGSLRAVVVTPQRQYPTLAVLAPDRRTRLMELAAHADFMREVVQPAIRREALELVQAHRSAGDVLAIVTATNAFVTRPIAQALGVTELIATELARDATPGGTGWYTGSIAGEPSFRQGKVTRVEQWLQARGWDWETVHTTFYSDSFNDLPLLERVTVPVATNPDARLRVLAQQRGWRILELFT